MGMTRFYMQKVMEERRVLGNNEGPLSRVVQMNKDISFGKYGVNNDFAGDEQYSINEQGTFLHKYSDRVLVLITDKCVANCAYCFRQKKLFNISISYEKLIDELIVYLRNHKEVKEVIISGGDFMTLKYDEIRVILEQIKKEGIENIRLHTRAIVFQPSLFSEKIIELLYYYNVRLYFHIVHPYEICDRVANKIREISKRIRCYNQFPLLRGINDDVEVLKSMISQLDALRVSTVVIYVADPLGFLEPYRVPIMQCLNLKHQFEETSPSWMNSLRMVFDSAYGKVNIDRLERIDDEHKICFFEHKGNLVEFPDFPMSLYKQSDKKILLWKNNP